MCTFWTCELTLTVARYVCCLLVCWAFWPAWPVLSVYGGMLLQEFNSEEMGCSMPVYWYRAAYGFGIHGHTVACAICSLTFAGFSFLMPFTFPCPFLPFLDLQPLLKYLFLTHLWHSASLAGQSSFACNGIAPQQWQDLYLLWPGWPEILSSAACPFLLCLTFTTYNSLTLGFWTAVAAVVATLRLCMMLSYLSVL